jgi:hypothetical protein
MLKKVETGEMKVRRNAWVWLRRAAHEPVIRCKEKIIKRKKMKNSSMDILYVSTTRANYFAKHFLTVQAKAKKKADS